MPNSLSARRKGRTALTYPIPSPVATSHAPFPFLGGSLGYHKRETDSLAIHDLRRTLDNSALRRIHTASSKLPLITFGERKASSRHSVSTFLPLPPSIQKPQAKLRGQLFTKNKKKRESQLWGIQAPFSAFVVANPHFLSGLATKRVQTLYISD